MRMPNNVDGLGDDSGDGDLWAESLPDGSDEDSVSTLGTLDAVPSATPPWSSPADRS